jgi:hypothetical protein
MATKTKANVLGPFQQDVLTILKKRPMTAGEVSEYYAEFYPGTHRGRNECAKRISELTKLGFVRNTGKTVDCPVTGYQATIWKTTSKKGYTAPKRG